VGVSANLGLFHRGRVVPHAAAGSQPFMWTLRLGVKRLPVHRSLGIVFRIPDDMLIPKLLYAFRTTL